MGKKEIKNSFWMISEKIISIFGLIFVTSFVAKYVGPGIYGQIALATTLFQIVQVVAQLGSEVIIFKRVSKNSSSGVKLIHSTVSIRFLIYIIVSIPILLYFLYHSEGGSVLYVSAAAVSCLFTSLDVYSIYFDAKLQSKTNTMVNIFGLVVSLLLRALIAIFKLNPLYLCIPIILTSLIPYILRRFQFKRLHGNFRLNFRYKKKYTKYILVAGSNLVISSLSVAIYPRLAVIMLGYYQSAEQVGILSVAATLAGSWAFVCNSVITSFLPSIFSEKDNYIALLKASKLNIIVLILVFPVIAMIICFGNYFIFLLYGESYIKSYNPLIILSIATCVSLLGTISARFIAKYSGYSFLSKKMFFVTIVSLSLNYILINSYGVMGAAYATLTTEIISLTILNYFYKSGIIAKLHFMTVTIQPFLVKIGRR